MHVPPPARRLEEVKDKTGIITTSNEAVVVFKILPFELDVKLIL